MATSSTSALDSQYNSAKGVISGALNKGSNLDKESFLLLLVTQFQHQDPLNPMDDKEFVAQLAQFSSLEQAMSTNENMTKLLDAQMTQQTMSAVNYIGKEVLARGYGVSKEGSTVTTVQYALNEQAVKGFVNIFDGGGQLVTTVDLPAKSVGIHWEMMFARARFRTPDMIEQHRLLNRVSSLVDAGELRTTHGETLGPINAANLREAHRRLESGSSIGKLVLAGW